MHNIKSILIICSFLILPTSERAPEFFDIAEVNFEKGVYKIENKAITGHIIDYYENDQLKFRYKVISGRLHGEAIEFYANGNIKSKRNYVFGKLFGTFTIYFQDGTKNLQMHIDQNRYGQGEHVFELSIAKKPGKKLKSRPDSYIIFYDENGSPLKRSENLPIEQQFNFKVLLDDELVYENK